MADLLYLKLAAAISEIMQGERLVQHDPVTSLLERAGANYTVETVELSAAHIAKRGAGEAVLRCLMDREDSCILITCAKDQMRQIAVALYGLTAFSGRCIVLTAGDMVVQKGSNGAANLLVALGKLRSARLEPISKGIYIVWRADVCSWKDAPDEIDRT